MYLIEAQKNDFELRTNFLSVDKKKALNSFGEFFKVGDEVFHQEETAGWAKIQSFEFDEKSNEVTAITDRGSAHIDFLNK